MITRDESVLLQDFIKQIKSKINALASARPNMLLAYGVEVYDGGSVVGDIALEIKRKLDSNGKERDRLLALTREIEAVCATYYIGFYTPKTTYGQKPK